MRIRYLAALPALLACQHVSEPTIRRPAWLGAPPRALEAPDTVRVGVPFAVTAYAAGSGSIHCNRPDGARITPGVRVARVEIFVRVDRGNLICTSDLRYYPIPVSLTFPTAGTSTIWVIGSSSSDVTYAPDSIARTVVVKP